MNRRQLLPFVRLWFLVTATWGAVRILSTQPEWVEEIVLKPIIFIAPLLLMVRKERGSMREALGLRISNRRAILLWGGGFGLFIVTESIVVSLVKHHAINYDFFTLGSLTQAVLISLATAFSEEALYRGYLLQRVLGIVGREVRANLLVSTLFTAAHLAMGIFVLHLRGVNLLSYLWLILILGLADGLIYLKTRSVYAPLIAHTLWNFSNGFFIIR